MTSALDEVARSPVSLSAIKVNESQSICAEPGSTLHYLGETPSMSAKALPDTATNKKPSVSLGPKTKQIVKDLVSLVAGVTYYCTLCAI